MLSKLVGQCNNNYHHSIDNKSVNADYFALTKQMETSSHTNKFKGLLLGMRQFTATETL